MNALILGGESPRHHAWVRVVAEALEPHYDKVAFLDYHHWQADGAEIDLEYELNAAAKLAGTLGDYIVVAKSIGTVIAILANARGRIAPHSCVFLGFPLRVVAGVRPEVAAGLKSLPRTVFVQNEQDPLGSAAAIQAYVEANPPARYKLQELPGDTHDYTDFKLIAQLAVNPK